MPETDSPTAAPPRQLTLDEMIDGLSTRRDALKSQLAKAQAAKASAETAITTANKELRDIERTLKAARPPKGKQ